MRFAEIPGEVLETLKTWRYDRIIEKHEGPERWESYLKHNSADPVDVGGHPVLIPRWWEDPLDISVLRWYPSPDGNSLTVFFKDPTLGQYYSVDDEWSWAGYLAVCDRVGDSELFAAVVYHEWFIVENAGGSSA